MDSNRPAFAYCLIHTATFFVQPEPQNDTERQLLQLLVSYKQNFSAPASTINERDIHSLSACFSWFVTRRSTLLRLNRKGVDLRTLKGVVGIHVLVFGICFLIMATHTFLPPSFFTV